MDGSHAGRIGSVACRQHDRQAAIVPVSPAWWTRRVRCRKACGSGLEPSGGGWVARSCRRRGCWRCCLRLLSSRWPSLVTAPSMPAQISSASDRTPAGAASTELWHATPAWRTPALPRSPARTTTGPQPRLLQGLQPVRRHSSPQPCPAPRGELICDLGPVDVVDEGDLRAGKEDDLGAWTPQGLRVTVPERRRGGDLFGGFSRRSGRPRDSGG